MSDFLLAVIEDEIAHAAQSPAEISALIARRAQFAHELRGQLRDRGRFRPSREGKRVRAAGVEDGPFAPALAAYYWIDAPSLDDAAAIAQRIPTLGSDVVDVRPVMKGVGDPTKDAKPGKVFGFGVLGAADNEAMWTAVMDRIDAETHDRFPAASFVGGNRLQPPTTGKRVAQRGERRATFDGPFLEAKEVIGGVFFLRMLTIEDAVRWANASRFIAHGTLEIRELWRS